MKKVEVYFILSVILLMVSCKENTSKRNKLGNGVSQKTILSFEFPDTVSMNTVIEGKLRYNTNDSSLKKYNYNERYIFLHVKTNQKNERLSLEKMKKITSRLVFEDTIGNGRFSFFAVFTKPGESTLHVVIEDVVFLREQNKENETGAIINETDLTKDVYVTKNKKQGK